MKNLQRWIIIVWVGWTLVGVGSAMAANVMYMKNGRKISAKSIQWREGAQEYRVEDVNGSIIPIGLAQVERMDIDKPADFDRAKGMVEGGQLDSALPILQKMVEDYKMMIWDNRARELLARAYFNKQDYKKAGDALEELFKNARPDEITTTLRRFYWDTLLLIPERQSTLKKDIELTITTGTRPLAAAAQVMRGQLAKNQGQKEEALLNFLRAAILYEDVTEVNPEALFKAAEMLDEIRDPRAAELRKKLKAQYPESEWAKRLM